MNKSHLVITIKRGQKIIIDENTEISFKDRHGKREISLRATIRAPREVKIQKISTEGINENAGADVHPKERKT